MIEQFLKPKLVEIELLTKKMFSLGCSPHHISMKSGERDVDYLLEVLVDGIHPLPSVGSDAILSSNRGTLKLSKMQLI